MTTLATDSVSVCAACSAQIEDQIAQHPDCFRVLIGDPSTGALHLGHYFGTLANRVHLQRAGVEVFLVPVIPA
jgi:tryptophanyl-tRNA synthetase